MSGKNFRVSDGDWICPDKKCGNVNFARRTSCNRCGREKTTEAKMMKAGGTEIGKTLAEKSRGLFSANDWQCKTCGNVNWARRSECNMCNTPKYAKLEERTGYGGGFNERENVEYIEREESDGEYDEFGRKKKKYRGKTSSTSSSKESEKKEVVKGEEEEEDDEDDEEGDLSKYKLDDDEEEDEEDNDGDLSKYDLDASDDDDKQAKKKGSRSGSSRSRSSSRSSSSSSRSRSRSRSRSSSSSRSGSRSRSHSRSSSRSGKGSSPRKRSRSPSSSPERRQKRSRSRSSSGGRKRRRSRSRSSERFGFLWNTTMALIIISHLSPRLWEFKFTEICSHFPLL
ncbi:zinc finger Ran-binding domain-containing protein 2 isoform X2 [Scomber scombrus]|uniref:zinc finger Ran-binding domain-containing protein 2 isoform X2 n=1 Tax=Scomber scombrus TaxID=13677 RepID=UPI002DDC720B|nr:zinc finger Ran-binding domain-containing protein 2 isoform X2 [Scomber scombrus]